MIALTSCSVLEKGFSKEAYRFFGDIDKSRKILSTSSKFEFVGKKILLK